MKIKNIPASGDSPVTKKAEKLFHKQLKKEVRAMPIKQISTTTTKKALKKSLLLSGTILLKNL
jgi:hypothetical protein